jgi:hypothetical protein
MPPPALRGTDAPTLRPRGPTTTRSVVRTTEMVVHGMKLSLIQHRARAQDDRGFSVGIH